MPSPKAVLLWSLTCLFLGCSDRQPGDDDVDFFREMTKLGEGETRRDVCWGESSKGKLLFVLFKDNSRSVFRQSSTMESGEALSRFWIQLPDGQRFELPGEAQLFEYSRGKLALTHRRVKKGQFYDFMDSNPHVYSIDSLLEFVDQHGAEPKAAIKEDSTRR